MIQARPNQNSEISIRDPEVSIIIPTYNEEENIGKVLQEIEQVRLFLPLTELIVVDDGSVDKTVDKVRRFPSVKYVRHEKNRGKGAALRAGVKIATGNIFVIQDADLEYPPSNIPKLLEPILNNRADVVYGSRFKGRHDGMSFLHFVGNKILSLTARLLYRAPITDVMTGHKCFRKEVIESIDLTEGGFSIEVEITTKILKSGWRFVEVPITYSRRVYGLAKIRYRDGLSSMLKLLQELMPISRQNGLNQAKEVYEVRSNTRRSK